MATALLLMALDAAMPYIDEAEVRATIQLLKEMTKAVPVVPPPGDPNLEKYLGNHRRLTELMVYVERFTKRVLDGQCAESEMFNYLQVCRDLTDTGVQLSRKPIEAIPWHRAMVTMTKPLVRIIARYSKAKQWGAGAVIQFTAQLALFERELQAAREKLRVRLPRQNTEFSHFRV